MSIGKLLLRLAPDPACADIIGTVAQANPRFLHDLAAAFGEQGRHEAALAACELLLRDQPHDLDSLLLSVRALAGTGQVEPALERLIAIRQFGLGGEQVAAETRTQLNAAAVVYADCLAAGNFARAFTLCDLLARLCPDVLTFQKARLAACDMLRREQTAHSTKLGWDHYRGLNELVAACARLHDFDGELQYRIELYRHPFDAAQHSALRVSNIAAALRRVLAVEHDRLDEAGLALARELLATIATLPLTPPAAGSVDDDTVACWDRFQRVLLGTIDLQAVFGPLAETPPFLPTRFISAAGEKLELSAIAGRTAELGARVVFFTSASAEYFARHAKTYVSSMLDTCDCGCMVFVCICAPVEQLAAITAGLGIDDRRLIFCCDDFHPDAAERQVFFPTPSAPSSVPGVYYAASALLRMDQLLQQLGLPVFVTGIDTVLQRGVVDLLERCGHADVVLNRMGSQAALGSQLVNNLVLTFPTENGLLFARFLKTYLGGHLALPVQPAYLDQLDLHMAKHHLMANGSAPKIEYFDESDIINIMFSHQNFRFHYDKMRSYRFLNMFVAGCADNPLTAEDVAEQAA